MLRVFKSFSLDSDLTFAVVEAPAIASVLVLNRPGDGAELVYLATSRQDAEEWLSRHGYPNAVLHEVTADAAAAVHVEGRVV